MSEEFLPNQGGREMSIRLQGRYIPVLLALILMVGMGSAATTEVHIVKYAVDGTTVLNETTVTYQWMMNNLPVLGDGVTHYYAQGPVFKDDPDPVIKELIRWNVTEDTNVLEKDMGAVRGTNVKDLCDLVGGMNAGETIKMTAPDGFTKYFAFKNVYEYSSREGPMVVTWEKNGLKPDTGYTDGMRLVWLADASTNPWGVNAFGNWDWHEAADSVYWYYYVSGAESYPTTTGLSVQTVSDIIIYSDDPVPVAPTAGFISDVQSGTAPLTVNFTDTSTGTTPLTYAWDFGDGTVDSTIKDPSHEYTMAGTYTVNLTVANAAGIDSEIKPDFITVNPPPDTTAPASVTNLTNTTFSQTLITWTWTDPADSDFEKVMVYLDGVWKQNVTKGVQSWTATGLFPDTEYTIGTRTVDTTGNMNATMVTDVARTAAVPDITAPASVTNLANTTFAQTSITWTWTDPADSDFEKVMVYLDGVWKQNVTKGIQSWTATGLVANTEYTIGTRTVDSTGNVNATTVSDPARTAPAESPHAQFTASPRDGPAPLAVQFTDQSTGSISSRSWDFTNDGTVDSTLANPVFTYSNPGTYTVNLTVMGPGGLDTEIKTGFISVEEPASGVSAQFTASPLAGSVPLTVRFTDQSSGEITSYAWDFNGDGTVDSRVKNPVTVYTSSGTYTVTLTVRGPDGMDTEVKTKYLSISGFLSRPNALFSMDKQFGSAPLTVHFTDKTLNNPDTFLWKFGDGTTSAERNPSHTYLTAGFYKVSLTASNEAGSSSRAMYVFVSGF